MTGDEWRGRGPWQLHKGWGMGGTYGGHAAIAIGSRDMAARGERGCEGGSRADLERAE